MNFNLMYSNSHITMGTSSDDLFEKSGKNQNSLHYKYNKFLQSPYKPRTINSIFSKGKTNDWNENKEMNLEDSLGETEIFYPKPNNYNSIYTKRFSKKYQNYYNNRPFYASSPTENYDYYNNYRHTNRNDSYDPNQMNLNYYRRNNMNTVKTPDYQIKKEIEFQKTPEKYNNRNEFFAENNRYNNYRRYDDYYNTNNKNAERFNSPTISKIAENNFINRDLNNINRFSARRAEDMRRNYYS